MDIKSRLVILNNLRITLPFNTTIPHMYLLEIIITNPEIRRNVCEIKL